MWYVIQVVGGKESATLELLNRFIGKDVIEEAFILRRNVMRRKQGTWQPVSEILFPGYLFVITKKPEDLFAQLKHVPRFTRLLGGSDRRFIPLLDREVELLEHVSGTSRVVEMSQGVIDGDRIRVNEGPLKGYEGIIRKIDRHKRVAFVEMEVMGRTKTVKVGLEIVRKNT